MFKQTQRFHYQFSLFVVDVGVCFWRIYAYFLGTFLFIDFWCFSVQTCAKHGSKHRPQNRAERAQSMNRSRAAPGFDFGIILEASWHHFHFFSGIVFCINFSMPFFGLLTPFGLPWTPLDAIWSIFDGKWLPEWSGKKVVAAAFWRPKALPKRIRDATSIFQPLWIDFEGFGSVFNIILSANAASFC